MALPVSVGALRSLVKEVQVSARDEKPLVVGGARELAAVLRRELGREAKPGAVRHDDEPKGAAVLVYVLAHEPSEEDGLALKRARRARVPIVAVAVGRVAEDVSIPFVLATDVVRVGAGEGFPVEKIAHVIAARLGEGGGDRAEQLGRPLTQVDLQPVGLLEPQEHPNLVQGEHGQVHAGEEHGRGEDAVLAGEARNELPADRAA